MAEKDSGSESAITDLLLAWSRGDESALDELMPQVYDRLHRLAASFLRRERPDHTLQTTDLVHEAFLKLVQQDRVTWRDRTQFFALAGRMTRRILVDHARRRDYQKRGGGAPKLTLDEVDPATSEPERTDLLALDDALHTLGRESADLVRIVELKYFSGLTLEEMADVTGLATATVHRRWRMARAWLHRHLTEGTRAAGIR